MSSVLSARRLALLQGGYYTVTGVWPLVHMRSFEAVSGPKVDRWLVRTVAGLLVTTGLLELRSQTVAELRQARIAGVGAAATLGAVGLFYGGRGRISRVYVLDGLIELGLVLGWVAAPVSGRRD